MKKYTLKEIKRLVNIGVATNINTLTNEEIDNLSKQYIDKIGYSCGTYGINGGLFRDKEGELYAITSRNTDLFRFF